MISMLFVSRQVGRISVYWYLSCFNRYQQMLHTNLVYLATIADSNQNMQSLLPAVSPLRQGTGVRTGPVCGTVCVVTSEVCLNPAPPPRTGSCLPRWPKGWMFAFGFDLIHLELIPPEDVLFIHPFTHTPVRLPMSLFIFICDHATNLWISL